MPSRKRTATIVCKTPEEAANIQRALDQVEVRAFLSIVGVLLPLGARGRRRTLEFVNDVMDEDNGRIRIETYGDGQHAVEASKAVQP